MFVSEFVIRVRRPEVVQKRVEERVRQRVCQQCDKPVQKLGMCQKCATRHAYLVSKCKSKTARKEFIRQSALNGYSLLPGEWSRLKLKVSGDGLAALVPA